MSTWTKLRIRWWLRDRLCWLKGGHRWECVEANPGSSRIELSCKRCGATTLLRNPDCVFSER